MTDLSAELDRPGLPAHERLLVVLTASIGPADWQRFDAAVALARARAVERMSIEETLLQATLFFGFPRVVSAFEQLENGWPAPAIAVNRAIAPRAQAAAGRALFDRIYGLNAGSVHTMLESFHPEFHAFVIESAYGRILARPALDPRVRELCAIGALAASNQIPQLIAHARGAIEFGASADQVREALHSAGVASAQLMRRILRSPRTEPDHS